MISFLSQTFSQKAVRCDQSASVDNLAANAAVDNAVVDYQTAAAAFCGSRLATNSAKFAPPCLTGQLSPREMHANFLQLFQRNTVDVV